ncbi:MAG: hypothetical protein J6R01_05800 [Alistipes sp.]|nr:hypothetical protein [Alistipes sp.]
MAIGNLFLGTARKTIGDIVMYRRNGEQLSRVRVRKIANPRTEAQALQRNYMAPVTKFYAPLADVLERSWEGLDRQKSLGAFLKTNAGIARSSGWYVVKGAGFTPLPYKVSNGTLAPLSYSDSELSLGGQSIADIKVSTISAALVNMGYQYGDQLTTIICLEDAAGDVRPVWTRVLLSSTDESDIFSDIAGAVLFEQSDTALAYSGVLESVIGAVFIVSRWNGSKWLRSSQYVQVSSTYLAQFTSIEARAAAIASYQSGDSVVSSDVYLNGGTGTKAKQDVFVWQYVDCSTNEIVNWCQPIEVLQGEGDHTIVVKARNLSNGAIMYVNVMNRYKRVLHGPGAGDAYRFTQREDVAQYALYWYNVSQSRQLYLWLQSQGLERIAG